MTEQLQGLGSSNSAGAAGLQAGSMNSFNGLKKENALIALQKQ